MKRSKSSSTDAAVHLTELAKLLQAVPPEQRASILQVAVSFSPDGTLEQSFAVGPIRAAMADYWQVRFDQPIPLKYLRAILEPPVPIGTVLEFNKLTFIQDMAEIEDVVRHVADHLQARLQQMDDSGQLSLFEASDEQAIQYDPEATPVSQSVSNLKTLIDRGRKYPTVYADPPWPYRNRASRGAAENHYPTMPIDDICAEPVGKLAEDNSHLHLWTTNAFLRESFDVMDAWGFRFKSCLIWVKDKIGMGNYWRVSHEFLLLGVRGRLTFRDHSARSWIQAPRTIHSRKPDIVRTLVESVSPGPYLELYGREELSNSAWTVYGNQIEKRLL